MLRRVGLALGIVTATAVLASCGGCGDDAQITTNTTTATTSGAGAGGSGQGGSIFGDAGPDEVVSVAIEPADPIVEVVDGVLPPPLQLKAIGTTDKGTQVDLSGTWAFDRFDVGSVDGSGLFTATGLLGGTGTVEFTSQGGLKGTTSCTVKLHVTSDPEAVDPSIKGLFAGASQDDPALGLLYPYDKTVFPRGLTAPVLQWNGGGAADVYYLHATSTTFEYEAWGTVPPPSRYAFPTMPTDVWKKLTDSTTGAITLDVQRYDGATAYKAKTQTWTIAPANLAGTIYYWEVNSGNVVRIKPGDTAPQDFLQKPAGVTCVACHSVSKDGSRMVASFHGGWSPWGTFEAATGASLFSSGTASGFEAISPNGSHVLWRHWNDGGFGSTGYLSLSTYDSTAELLQLDPGGGAPSHPAWSGDGAKIAFAVRTDGNGLDFTQSTLWITDVDLAVPSFANTKQIVVNDATRPTLTYPTFSPDSKWIGFERSTQARSRGAQAEIWLTSLDGTTQIPLDALNGVGYLAADQANATYEPTFMPVSVGGYFWIVVVSERTYGNTLVDTNPNSRHKQLWVAAIDADPKNGVDPSHPGFWLPGQGIDNNNLRGEWALSPCKKIGEDCSAGYECCDGFCHTDDAGTSVCEDNPGGCSHEGEACTTAADCCDPGATCTGGFCGQIPQ